MIDTSIYQNIRPVQTPDILGNAEKAMNLSQLALQNQKLQKADARDQAIRSALSSNIGADGKLNQQGVLSTLGKLDPQAQFDSADKFSKQNKDSADAQSAQLDVVKKVVGQTLPTMQALAALPEDQRSQAYPSAMKQLEVQGVPMNNVPKDQNGNYVYDPQHFAGSYATLQKTDDYFNQQNKIAGTNKDNAETRKINAETGKIQSETQKRMPDVSQTNDPAKLVAGMVPKEHQAAAFKEIDTAENTKANAPAILNAFDSAANKFHGVDLVPGMLNADQKSMHALLGPTFKDVEGTVRQAAMTNLYDNVTPQVGDSKETLEKKRSALVGYLNSKSSAPTARGYNVDLANFPSTAPYKDSGINQNTPPKRMTEMEFINQYLDAKSGRGGNGK
jgi:hypothetical protein